MGLYYQPQSQEHDANGNPLNGGQLFFYEPGTTTLKTVYQDLELTTAHANPVVADSAGRWDPIYLDGSYKVVLKNSSDVTIWTEDNISTGGGALFGTTVSLSSTTAIDTTYSNNHIRCTGTINLNLVAIATAGTGFVFSVRNDGTGIVTIDPNASEQINDTTSINLGPGDGGLVIAGTSEWSYVGVEAQKHWAKGADVASANALTLGTDGNYFDITGTTAITSIGTLGIGTVIKLHFDGALTLTHHATDLVLPSGANITTAAGDEAEFIEYASGDWRCTNYMKANGEPVSSSGGLILLGTYTASSDTSVDIGSGLDLNAAIDSTYDEYELHIIDLVPATDNTDLYLRTSTDGGSTFDAGASNYRYIFHGADDGGAAFLEGSIGATQIAISDFGVDLGSGTGEGYSAVLKVFNPSAAKYTTIGGVAHYFSKDGTATVGTITGTRLASSDVDALRVLMSSGNITSGEFKLYGVRKS